MGRIENYSFRQLADHYVLLTDIPQELFRLLNTEFQCIEGDNALLTYGYIDHEAGLTFEVLCFAKFHPYEQLELRPGNDKTTFKIRYDEMRGNVHIVPYDISMNEFQKKIKIIEEGYYHNEQLKEIRLFEVIDEHRDQQFPDDVSALLYKTGHPMERVWVRTDTIENGKIVGILLNQPNSDVFGFNQGDRVVLVMVLANGRRFLVVEVPDVYE